MNSAGLAAIAATLGLLTAGCTTEPVEHLTGCFSLDADQPVALRVMQNDEDQYSVSLRNNDKWGDAKPMKLGDAELANSLFGEDGAKVQASLVSDDGPIILFRVEPKSKISGATADTGFIGSFYFGVGQLYKAESCEDA